MSTYIRMLGVKIYCNDRYTENSYIGLYTPPSSGNSEFRWIEDNDILNISNWYDGILIKNAFSPIKEGADLKKIGNRSYDDYVSITIKNTEQFSLTLQDNDIYIDGCRAEIWEFEYNVALSTTTTYVIKYGFVENKPWNETDYNITIRESHLKRRAYMGKLINEQDFPYASEESIGKMVPLSFGYLVPEPETGSPDIMAKFVRTANNIDEYETDASGILTIKNSSQTTTYQACTDNTSNNVFPVVSVIDGLTFYILIANNATWKENGVNLGTGVYTLDNEDLYVEVIQGNGIGEQRRVTALAVQIGAGIDNRLQCVVADYFENTPVGNSTATAENNTWFKLMIQHREYQCDTWPCEGFYNESGVSVSKGASIYAFESKKTALVTTENTKAPVVETSKEFIRLPQYGVDINTDGNKNKLDIDVKLFKDGIDQMSSFLILPISNPSFSDVSVSEFNNTWFPGTNFTHKLENGYYVYLGSGDIVPDVFYYNSLSDICDKDKDTSLIIYFWYGGTAPIDKDVKVAVAIQFLFPDIPDKFDWDNVYFGLYANATKKTTPEVKLRFIVAWNRFIGTASNIDLMNETEYNNTGILWNNTLDNYYISPPNNNNRYFYESNTGPGIKSLYSGYMNANMSGTILIGDKKQYKGLKSGMLILYLDSCKDGLIPGDNLIIDIYDACIIFKKDFTIKEEVYSPIYGRIYNDTWGGRKGSSFIMSQPHAIIEHACRLQDWSDRGALPPSAGWGKAYSASAHIDISSNYGGFDGGISYFGSALTYTARGQITDYEKSNTDQIIRTLCGDFYFCQWTRYYATTDSGDSGKECITYLFNNIVPTETITLNDIVGDIGDLIEPEKDDIHCEPVINYCYNHARGKFDKLLQITNVGASAWTAAYTPGFSGSEGEYFWNKCHAKYLKYGHVEPMPQECSDKYWIYSDSMAKIYLELFLSWMELKRISLSVFYEKGRSYFPTMKVYLNLPHQTGGIASTAMIERIEKSLHNNYVKCDLMLLDYLETETYYYQDTYETVPLDWQDEYAGTTDKQKEM